MAAARLSHWGRVASGSSAAKARSGKGVHQLLHQPVGKPVADGLRQFAHAVKADDDDAERAAAGAGVAALLPEIAGEGGLYAFGFRSQTLQQHFAGGETGPGIEPSGLVQFEIVETQAHDAGQGRQQGRHPFRIGHAGHEHAEQFPLPDEGQQQLALVRQPFRFRRTGLTGEIDGVRLKGKHAVQAVPEPLLQVQQVAADKSGRHAYHVRRTGTPRSAMYRLSCSMVYSP